MYTHHTCLNRACFGYDEDFFWNQPVSEPTAKAPASTSKQKHKATNKRLWLDSTIAMAHFTYSLLNVLKKSIMCELVREFLNQSYVHFLKFLIKLYYAPRLKGKSETLWWSMCLLRCQKLDGSRRFFRIYLIMHGLQ